MPPDRRSDKLCVLVTEPIHPDGLEVLLKAGLRVESCDWPATEIQDDLSGVHGLITRICPVGPELLRRAYSLRVIGKHGVGLDNIDLEAATKLRIPVVLTPDTTTEAVAEFTVMQMLRLARGVRPAETQLAQGHFDKGRRAAMSARELRHRTVGVVGFGRIGQRVAEICTVAFGMHVIAFDPYVNPDSLRSADIESAFSLRLLLRHSEFLTLHVPLTSETKGMIGSNELGLMPAGSFLINCARGGLVDEQALAEALASRHLSGAAVDAFAVEPVSADNPLLKFDNVLASPHVAGGTNESLQATSVAVANRVLEVLRGEPASYVANPEVWERR